MGMPKYDRLLYILNLLRSRRNLNAMRLAEECGVTERSIYRDIVALSEANIPIYYDNGYKLASDNFLPPLNLDHEELLCLRMLLESSPLNKVGSHAELIKGIRAKLEASASAEVRREALASPQPLHLSIDSTTDSDQCRPHFAVIESAIERYCCLKMRYESLTSGETERVVEPYFIVFRGRAFYFVAFCRMREELRTFRIDRIRSLELTDLDYVRDPSVNPESYFANSWLVATDEPVEVVVRFRGIAAMIVSSGRHHPGELVELVDEGAILYRVTVRGLDEIHRWLLGFGDKAEVIKPSALIDRLRETANQVGSLYDQRSR